MFSTCFPRANRGFSFPRANRGFSFPRANRGFNPLLRRGAAGAENLGLCAGANSRALRADLDLHGRRDACRRPRGKARATARDATAGRDRAVRPGLPHEAPAARSRRGRVPARRRGDRQGGGGGPEALAPSPSPSFQPILRSRSEPLFVISGSGAATSSSARTASSRSLRSRARSFCFSCAPPPPSAPRAGRRRGRLVTLLRDGPVTLLPAARSRHLLEGAAVALALLLLHLPAARLSRTAPAPERPASGEQRRSGPPRESEADRLLDGLDLLEAQLRHFLRPGAQPAPSAPPAARRPRGAGLATCLWRSESSSCLAKSSADLRTMPSHPRGRGAGAGGAGRTRTCADR